MSDFSDKLNRCMSSKGLPPPNLESLNEAMERIHQLTSAWEAAGGELSALIGPLLGVSSELAGLSEEATQALAAAASVTVTWYVQSCATCIASNWITDLIAYNSANPPQDKYLQDLYTSVGADPTVASA